MFGFATTQDVRDAERRILAAIELSAQNDKQLAAVLVRARNLERRTLVLARKLGKLDAQT